MEAVTGMSRAIKVLDRTVDKYMKGKRRPGSRYWRAECHRSAQVAAAALQLLFPQVGVQVRRVELAAYMVGGERMAHIGWSGDTRVIEGHYPMHFAVQVGEDLYDATAFWQLRNMQTPLALPEEPYCHVPGAMPLLEDPKAAGLHGFLWMSNDECRRVRGLRFGYLLRSDPLPPEMEAHLISPQQARADAIAIANQFSARFR